MWTCESDRNCFCEACGKPFESNENTKLLDMRYEGVLGDLSRKQKRLLIKFGAFLFCKSRCMAHCNHFSCIGDRDYFSAKMYITPGIAPAEYYKQEYGFLGQLYYQLGFNNLYGSWWYMMLIASIGISLVICSLDRVIPLYKALKKQGVKRHPSF